MGGRGRAWREEGVGPPSYSQPWASAAERERGGWVVSWTGSGSVSIGVLQSAELFAGIVILALPL